MVPPRPICLIASLLRGSNTANQVERDFPTRRYSGRSRQARTEQDRKHASVLKERERELSQDIANQSAHLLLPIVSPSARRPASVIRTRAASSIALLPPPTLGERS